MLIFSFPVYAQNACFIQLLCMYQPYKKAASAYILEALTTDSE